MIDKAKVQRAIRLNSHYMVLFKNPEDDGQMRSLSQQLFHNKVKFFMESIQEAIKNHQVYLLLDIPLSHQIHPVCERVYLRVRNFRYLHLLPR